MSKLSLNKRVEKDAKKAPKVIVLMFWALAFIAGFNIIVDLTSNSAEPFGFFGRVLAQVTNRLAPNTGAITRILQGYQKIEGQAQITDTYDRCLVVDPNLGGSRQVKNIGSRTNAALGENLGGANTPFVVDFPDFRTTPQYIQTMDYAEEMGMSYVLGLTTKTTSADLMAQFVNEATERGFVPVVRLCVVGACEFDLSNGPGQIIDYYRELSRLTTGEFIAILGPNEPGSGEPLEMEGFDLSLDQYPQLVQYSIEAANALKGQRVVNGGNMYLAPAAFNVTNAINDDAKLYFENGLADNTDIFDVLLINTYDLSSGTAYSFYENTAGGFGLKAAVDQSELAVVVTEFGSFVEPNGSNFDQLKVSFDEFCQDENVEGVLFFRSFQRLAGLYGGGNDPNAKPPGLISDEVLEEMLSGCSKGSLRDYAWVNCNFDTCLYGEAYDPKSTAEACGVRNPEPRTELNSVALGIQCIENRCYTSFQNSIQVIMPIKQFGSNSWTGTPNFNYPPICAELAHLYPNDTYDALNQFAGLLLSGGEIVQSQNSSPSNNELQTVNKSIVILGDSQTAPGPERGEFLPSSSFTDVNRSAAIAGSNANDMAANLGVLSNLSNGIPDVVLIGYGTNDCGLNDPEGFRSDLQTIINYFPNSKIILLSIPNITNNTLGISCPTNVLNQYNNVITSLRNDNVSIINLESLYGSSSAYLYSDNLHIGNYDLLNAEIYRITNGSESNTNTSNITSQVSGGLRYPMPWLGSALNCSSELIKQVLEYQDEDGKINYSPSPGSLYTETKAEVAFELENQFLKDKGITVEGDISNRVLDSLEDPGYITDERAMCLDDECIDKSDIYSSPNYYGEYIPARLAQNYEAPEACAASGLLIRNEPNNYIYGPEIWNSDRRSYFFGSGAEVCINYANRKSELKDPRYLFEKDAKVYCSIANKQINPAFVGAVPPECTTASAIQALQGLQRCFAPYDDNALSHNGTCGLRNVNLGLIEKCLVREPTSRGDFFITPNAFDTNLPTFEIPGVYDSVYEMYSRTQDVMSRRYLKIVFRENLGWKTIVENKIRDANRPFDIGEPYLFSLNHNNSTCSSSVSYVTGDVHLGKNNPIQRKEIYYDWLGYLDIMQEWIMVYARDQHGTAEVVIPNPLYLENEENTLVRNPEFEDIQIPTTLQKDTIVLSGTASQNTRFPIWTCDEVEFRKLGIKFDENRNPIRVDQYETFPQDFNPTCIDWYNSESYEDGLKEFLCSKNPNAYSKICDVVPIDPGDLVCRTPDGDIIEPGTFSGGVTCPLSGGACIQGAAGDVSHARSGLNAVDIKNSNNQLIAPFDGRVTGIIGNYCARTTEYNGGDGIIYEGTIEGQEYSLLLYHLNVVDSDVVVGKEYKTGEPIAPLADDGRGGSGRSTPTFDIPSYSNGRFIFSEQGRRPSGISSTSNRSITNANTLSCDGSGYTNSRHVHLEVLSNRSLDVHGFSVALGCDPGSHYSCSPSGAPVGEFPPGTELICEYEGEEEEIPPGNGPATGCNEFNCAMGAGWSDNFAGSLECASNTLRNNIFGFGRRQHSLAELLDSYVPYCYTVTVAVGRNGKSTMSFLSNFFGQIYDPYAYVKRKDASGNTCSTSIPDTPREQDIGMACPGLPERKEGTFTEPWNYYVGPLETCSLSTEEMTWVGSVGSRSTEDVTQYVIDNISYFGITIDENEEFGVPREKVQLVIETSRNKDINPFLLIGVWATESAFGTYWDPNHTCNVY